MVVHGATDLGIYDPGHEFDLAAQRREQKSFGSFLQKRTFC
jgi:hypothetical protein